MKNNQKIILRYTPFERANHWLSAITFIMLALSGLSLFHPAFYPLSQFFGGGVWTRVLHPFIGVVMSISFGIMIFNYWRLNILKPADWEWLKHVREMVNSDDSDMPEAGKFNGGQKVLFWFQVACIVLLILSGLIIWRSYFSFLFSIGLIRFASVIHSAAASLMIGLIIFHIYASVWTKESINAMLYGYVRRAWVKQHHPAWFREMTRGRK